MAVQYDKTTGRRWIEVEVEVPGTPEAVWEAIATGPGISAWFCPTRLEERVGGRLVAQMGPGMEGVGTVTVWDPPRRFAAEGPSSEVQAGAGPEDAADSPALRTEWTIEARSGGACRVRVVHSLFTDSDAWDDELEGFESGWPTFFAILRVYLARFAGERATIIRTMGQTVAGVIAGWRSLTGALGLAEVTEGAIWRSPAGTPALHGVLETRSEGTQPYAVARIESPAPGIAAASAFRMGSQTMVTLGLYLYGTEGESVAARDAARWQDWSKSRFG